MSIRYLFEASTKVKIAVESPVKAGDQLDIESMLAELESKARMNKVVVPSFDGEPVRKLARLFLKPGQASIAR